MIRHRWYESDRDNDLQRMLALVSEATIAAGPRAGHLHPGDVVWGLFQNTVIDPTTRVHLFEEASGELAGFVWLYPPRHFMVALAPGVADPPATFAMMTAWAETHLSDGARVAGTPLDAITTETGSIDHVTSRLLTGVGYRPTGEADFQGNHQVLDRDLPDVPVPEGATVRAVNGGDERDVAARVDLHREVWAPSKFTVEGYRRLRERPVYRPDLDLVAVTPEGDLAAYAIVWWDPASRTGLFEPVGSAARHRGKRYGSAVMVEGLRRLRALEATDAVVGCATRPESEPARRLYASTGFEVVCRWETWRKPIA
ncbi:MAG TPA: GNAT family N-acetyltransferase [Thermomicrobiales bacterium]|nr:GNAT family N-acetyltransferase [Thermomicrobiales bacterium]